MVTQATGRARAAAWSQNRRCEGVAGQSRCSLQAGRTTSLRGEHALLTKAVIHWLSLPSPAARIVYPARPGAI